MEAERREGVTAENTRVTVSDAEGRGQEHISHPEVGKGAVIWTEHA